MSADPPRDVDAHSENEGDVAASEDERRFRFREPPRADSNGDESETDAERSDITVLRDGFVTTWRTLYRNSAELIAVSFCWFAASVPIITIGPATVWAYAVIGELVENDRFEPRQALGIARERFVGAVVFSTVPLSLTLGTGVFFWEFAQTGSDSAKVLAVGSAYGWIFAGLVLIPTYLALADGDTPIVALKRGYLWTSNHPTLALLIGFVTLAVLLATAALTVGFVLLFAGIAFTFQRAVVTADL